MKLRIVKKEMETSPGDVGFYVQRAEGDEWRFEMFHLSEDEARKYVDKRIANFGQKIEPQVIAEFTS